MNRNIAFIALAALLFCSGPVAASSETAEAADYVHTFTGFTFPPSLGVFARMRVTPYNKERSDIEVDYDDSPYTTHVSVYVYPASAPLDQHYGKCKSDVTTVHPDAKLLEEKPVTFHKSGVAYKGYSALYTFRDKFVADTPQDLLSRLIVFRRDNYYVLFRISYSLADKVSAEMKIDKFLDSFVWPPGGTDASGVD